MNEKLYNFIEKDHMRTLFPLNSTKIFAKYGLDEILKFIKDDIFNSSWLNSIMSNEKLNEIKQILGNDKINKIEKRSQHFFLVQPLVYASKDRNHLRQTFLLDPITQIYLYDFVYENKKFFERKTVTNRRSFGYCFENKNLVSGIEEHKEFKSEIYDGKAKYEWMAKLDIANCFNNIYHHDIVSFIARLIGQKESNNFGRFLREINEGRSTNCMPQGIIPSKIIGSFYLSFIEESRQLKSERIIRFMDDIFLFSNRKDTIHYDVINVQKLIGEKGFSLNEAKSAVTKTKEDKINEIEDIKKSLLQKRESFIDWYSGEIEEDKPELTEEQEEYLKTKLHDTGNLEDEDIELILTLLSTTQEETAELVNLVLEKAPHLTKNLYHSIKRGYMYLNDDFINVLNKHIINNDRIHEFQLFWLAKILISFTKINESVVDILLDIYSHLSVTNTVKCLILEVQENGYGLLELKKNIARGNAPELVISAIVGLLGHEKSNRNQIYNYVAKSNPIMKIYTGILKKLDGDSVLELISVCEDIFEFTDARETISENDINEDPFAVTNTEIRSFSDDDLPF